MVLITTPGIQKALKYPCFFNESWVNEYMMRSVFQLCLWFMTSIWHSSGPWTEPLFLFAFLLQAVQHRVIILFIQWRQEERETERGSYHSCNFKWSYRDCHICGARICVNSNVLYFTNSKKCSWDREKEKNYRINR